MTRRLLVRPVACAALGLVLGACGRGEPTHRGRSAQDLVDALGGDAETAGEATAALAEMARTDPDPVLGALEKALRATPTPAASAPFTLALDVEAAAREGLPPLPDSEAVNLDLGPIRNRAVALGEPVSLHARREGTIEVVATSRPRAEAEWLQRVLSVRGAFELALVATDDPRKPGATYDGSVPLQDLRASEVERFVAARKAGEPYVPSIPRWRVVPRIGTKAESPDDFEVVRTAAGPEESFAEDAFADVGVARDPAGPDVVVATVSPSRRGRLRALTASSVGGRLAMILDGTVVALPTLEDPVAEQLVLPVPKELQSLGAKGLAAVLAGRRLPLPLRPVPLPPAFDQSPPPDTSIARAFVAVGEAAAPTLERVRDGDAPPHVKAQALWALDRVRQAGR